MKDLKIIGIGSPYGMDRAGWQVIDYLVKYKQQDMKNSQLLKLDRPATELLGHLNNDEKTIIIDAVHGNDEVGTVVRLKLNDIPESNKKLSSHGVGLSDALQLADALGQLPKELLIFGLETGGDIICTLKPEYIREVSEQIIKEAGYHNHT